MSDIFMISSKSMKRNLSNLYGWLKNDMIPAFPIVKPEKKPERKIALGTRENMKND